ncbi:unnamed protein product [Blepharisma stoltei]|uniref:Uncharacterized protein n=1 Tax=Blepharisma stoltei TaxID=1481888 RepID=A0AAU9ILY6_9CILI|nr:unnamed protein product [Blepharisma stoltei]
MELKTQNSLKLLHSQLNSDREKNEGWIIQYQFNTILDNQLLDPQDLKAKTSVILSSANSPEIEWDYRRTCSLYEKQSSASALDLQEAFQGYLNAYHQISSLYLIREANKKANLCIYNTESEKEIRKPLKFPKKVNITTCIAQLPNGKLFCFGGIAFTISDDFSVIELPPGTPCYLSSAIYFSKSVYCFGGSVNGISTSAFSERFDLDKNRWFKLPPMM